MGVQPGLGRRGERFLGAGGREVLSALYSTTKILKIPAFPFLALYPRNADRSGAEPGEASSP